MVEDAIVSLEKNIINVLIYFPPSCLQFYDCLVNITDKRYCDTAVTLD